MSRALTTVAQALARRHAEVCNVNYDDLWKLEGESFLEDAARVMQALHFSEVEGALQLVLQADQQAADAREFARLMAPVMDSIRTVVGRFA